MLGRLVGAVGRGRGVRSDDPREIERVLDRGLKRWMRDDGDPVQFIGQVHTPATYEEWRSGQLKRISGAVVPTLPAQRWPLVLWVMKPSDVLSFVHGEAVRGLLVAPQVGMFEANVDREVALAALIGAYLAEVNRTLRIAPPLLAVTVRSRIQLRLSTLERPWTLPATEAVGVRR